MIGLMTELGVASAAGATGSSVKVLREPQTRLGGTRHLSKCNSSTEAARYPESESHECEVEEEEEDDDDE